MSVADYCKDAVLALWHVLSGVFGWVVIAPLAALVPRNRSWIAVIGRCDGRFIDNCKYFFIDASAMCAPDMRIVYVTEREDVQEAISAAGLEALRYPSFAALWFLARCGVAVVDSVEWCEKGRFFVLIRARLVQLWHGVGFKRIELTKWRSEASGRRFMSSAWVFWLRMLRKRLRGRFPRYDVVVTTSRFYKEQVFEPAFRHRHVLTLGYPRNDFARFTSPRRGLEWGNVDTTVRDRIAGWKSAGKRLVLIAPTFRDTRATPLGLDAKTRELLDTFADEQGYEFLFKLHPYERGLAEISGRHLHLLDGESDVYPLFPFVDVMITDYSSIFVDFLLFDRPVLFLTPDLDLYLKQDRDIQFDFEEMTPGPKCESWRQLIDMLSTDVDEDWRDRRQAMRRLAFDDISSAGATKRLLDFMGERHWIPAGSLRLERAW
jgi:CDP-glycerol glycerophosphotransferase (TagB/SpsB family)